MMTYQLPWQEMKDRISNAIFLSAAAMLGSFFTFVHQYNHLWESIFNQLPTSREIFYLSLAQAFIVFSLAVLCSLVGFLYSDRLRLPGFGHFNDLFIWLPGGLAVGTFLTPFSYLLFDREMLRLTPGIYPNSWEWAVATVVGGAVAQEVIVRFGLLTIGVYLLQWIGYHRHPWPAIAVISTGGAGGVILFIAKFDLFQNLPVPHILTALLFAFVLQWIFCETYLRKGLVATICIHIGLAVKFLIFSLGLNP
jgi:hypothetical protein